MQRHLSFVLLASLILVLSGCEEKPMQESVQEPVVEQLDDKADKADETTQSVGDQNTEEEHAEYSSFYELTFNMDDALVFTYGTSLDAMEDIIVCE